MSQILKDLYIAGGVVFLFGAAIFVHEFGHYWVARKRGLKVEAFAIGFGPKIFSWVRDGIEYSVRWIPAGGFVKLPQMITSSALEGDAKKDEGPPPPAAFKNSRRCRRAIHERRVRVFYRDYHLSRRTAGRRQPICH